MIQLDQFIAMNNFTNNSKKFFTQREAYMATHWYLAQLPCYVCISDVDFRDVCLKWCHPWVRKWYRPAASPIVPCSKEVFKREIEVVLQQRRSFEKLANLVADMFYVDRGGLANAVEVSSLRQLSAFAEKVACVCPVLAEEIEPHQTMWLLFTLEMQRRLAKYWRVPCASEIGLLPKSWGHLDERAWTEDGRRPDDI